MDSQKKHPQEFSFEFFPPKTEQGLEKLKATCEQLNQLKPKFFSVTFGAGGSTRDRTFDTVVNFQKTYHTDFAPHISCIASTKAELTELLHAYVKNNIRRIVVLRGDRPSGVMSSGEMKHANELVAFIREVTGDHFFIEVAAYPEFHPESRTPETEIRHFKAKVGAGANSALTQYFYNPDSYFHFVDLCEKAGIQIPIVPGIMPITNFEQLARFSDGCGTEIPRWIRKSLEAYGDDLTSIRAFGLDVVTNLCARLLEQGAPGLHFYTMNQVEPTLSLWNRLDLSSL